MPQTTEGHGDEDVQVGAHTAAAVASEAKRKVPKTIQPLKKIDFLCMRNLKKHSKSEAGFLLGHMRRGQAGDNATIISEPRDKVNLTL